MPRLGKVGVFVYVCKTNIVSYEITKYKYSYNYTIYTKNSQILGLGCYNINKSVIYLLLVELYGRK